MTTDQNNEPESSAFVRVIRSHSWLNRIVASSGDAVLNQQMKPRSVRRVWLARGIAVGADILQIALLPVTVEGLLSPVNDALDIGVCIVLTLLVGWHIAFAPTFIIKELPFADLAPTWTVAVLIATGGKGRRTMAQGDIEGPGEAEPTIIGGRKGWQSWYAGLSKPFWTPSPRTISRIWTLLYPIIFTTFAWVFIQAARGKVAWPVTIPFAINLAANLLFTPILFGLRSLRLALLDILLVLATLIWAMVIIWPQYRLIALAESPYLVWVCIASVLQIRITRMNRR